MNNFYFFAFYCGVRLPHFQSNSINSVYKNSEYEQIQFLAPVCSYAIIQHYIGSSFA